MRHCEHLFPFLHRTFSFVVLVTKAASYIVLQHGRSVPLVFCISRPLPLGHQPRDVFCSFPRWCYNSAHSAMLTCPPVRVNLTAADISDFERRHQARRAHTHRRISGGGLRLARSPGRPARLGFVPANANLGRRRALSSCSQATFLNTEEDELRREDGLVLGERSRGLITQAPAQALAHEALNTGMPSSSSSQPSALDGTLESFARPPLDIIPPERVQHEPQDDRSSARAASKSPQGWHDFRLHEDTHHVQRHIERQHLAEWAARRRLRPHQQHAPPARDNNVPTIITQPPTTSPLRDVQASDALPNPALDPSAPVFMPRTRFASNLSNTTDFNDVDTRSARQGSSIESVRNSAHLRIRSSFERNSQYSSRGHDDETSERTSNDGTDNTTANQQRSTRRMNDQNAALQRPIPNLDRYPAVRPQVPPTNSRSSSNPQRAVVLPRRQSSRQHLVEFERTRRPHHDIGQHRATSSAQYSTLAVPLAHGGLRSSSPATSTTSQSTPNLLNAQAGPRFPARSSSLRQKNPARPNHIDDFSTASSSNRSAQRTSESGTSVQDWLFRDSPLDELTHDLTRLAGRPRSVGRSFERPSGNRSRVSLLTGDPFRLTESEEERSSFDGDSDSEYATFEARVAVRAKVDSIIELPQRTHQAKAQHSGGSNEEDPVALSLALPSPEIPASPASPAIRSDFQTTPTTANSRAATSQSSTPRQTSPTTQTSTPTSAPPHPAASAAPRVPVYNDSLSPNTQPQMPADMMRRGRGRSDVSASTRRHQMADATMADQTRTPYRHTYPSAVLPQQSPEHLRSPERMPVVAEDPARETQHAARAHQQGSGSSENEIEPVIGELEQDRRTWMRRQEDGSLDVTPPAEGRFERFLS